jgi:VCBS repeat-containing protein
MTAQSYADFLITKLVEADAAVVKAQTVRDAIREELLIAIEAKGVKTFRGTFGTATITERKTWDYSKSEEVIRLEAQLKAAKTVAQKLSVAFISKMSRFITLKKS